MGIKGLFPYLREEAPGSIKEQKLACYAGRTLAIDASTFLYQFLVAIRTGDAASHLSNRAGDATSHLSGFLNRTIKVRMRFHTARAKFRPLGQSVRAREHPRCATTARATARARVWRAVVLRASARRWGWSPDGVPCTAFLSRQPTTRNRRARATSHCARRCFLDNTCDREVRDKSNLN